MWTLKNLLLFVSCVCLLFLCVIVRIKPEEEVQFEVFLKRYNKSYPDDTDYQMRLQAFKDSLETINRLNALRTSTSSALYGITEFSDLPQKEFIEKHLQNNYAKRSKLSRSKRTKRTAKMIPNTNREQVAELQILKNNLGVTNYKISKFKHFKAKHGFVKSKEVKTLKRKIFDRRSADEAKTVHNFEKRETRIYQKEKTSSDFENYRKRTFELDDEGIKRRKRSNFQAQEIEKYHIFKKLGNAGIENLINFEDPNKLINAIYHEQEKDVGLVNKNIGSDEQKNEVKKIERPSEDKFINSHNFNIQKVKSKEEDRTQGNTADLEILESAQSSKQINAEDLKGKTTKSDQPVKYGDADYTQKLREPKIGGDSKQSLEDKKSNNIKIYDNRSKEKLIDAGDSNTPEDENFELSELFDFLKSNQIRQPPNLRNLPVKMDWRERGVVTEVNNQHSCGACWAFSVVEMIESMNAINGNVLEKLSTQQLIDCARNGNTGCKGGYVCPTLEWIMEEDIPLVSENRYPLHLKTETCNLNKTDGRVRIKNYSCDTYVSDEEYLLFALAYQGPVAVVINAMHWQYYLEGVIHFHCSSERQHLNHAAQIVGYNLEAQIPHYIVRNSWGTGFGDHGYLYVAIGSNMCGLANEVALVQV